MSALIKIKSSTVADKVPASLAPAELAVNLTDQKLYTADVDGNVFELGTTGGAIPSPTPPSNPNEGDLWFDSDNDTLNFWDGSQWVELGEASASGVVSVNTKIGVVVLDADDVGAVATTGKAGQSVEGSLNVEGKVSSASTAADDPGTTLVTKDFVDGGGGGTGDIGFWNRTGTDLSPVNSADDLKDLGSITAAGTVTADSFVTTGGEDIPTYEEGTFTPTIGNTGFTYTYTDTTIGEYIIIGNQVTIRFKIVVSSSTGSSSGSVPILTLPEAASATFAYSNAVNPQPPQTIVYKNDINASSADQKVLYMGLANGATTYAWISDPAKSGAVIDFFDNTFVLGGSFTYTT